MAARLLAPGRLAAAGLAVVSAAGCGARSALPTASHARPDVSVSASYIGEAAANPRGGVRQDATFVGRASLATDVTFDGGRRHGRTIRLIVTNRHGRDLGSVAIGSSTGVQEVYSPQATHLARLTYQQAVLDGRVEVEAGRTAANLYFLTSGLCAYLQTNAACGSPTFAFKTSNLTYFPASSWGARAKARFGDDTFAEAGVFEVNPDRRGPGATGLEWSVTNATGVIVPFQVGHTRSDRAGRSRGRLEVGGWYDASSYADPLIDDAGIAAVASGRPPATRRGRSGAFVAAEQVAWRAPAHPDRSLTVFGRVLATVRGRTTQDYFVELGVLGIGPAARRRRDSLAFVFTVQRFSDLAQDSVRAAQATVGGAQVLSRHQYMMEIAYGVPLPLGGRVSPNLQLIVNPDPLADPRRRTEARDVVVGGLKFTWSLPLAAGAGRGRGTDRRW
jgi:porin